MRKINIFRDVMMLVYARGVNMFASMAYGMILVRVFSKEQYGAYSQVLIIINLCVVILGLSVPNSINYFLPKSKDIKEKRAILSQIILLTNLLGITAALFLLIGRNIISKLIDGDISSLLVVACLLPFARMLSPLYDDFFVVVNKAEKVAVRRSIIAAVQIITVSLVWFFKLNVFQLFLVITVTEILIGIYIIFSIRKEIRELTFFKIDWKVIKSILIFSLPLAAASTVGTINTEIGKIIVSKFYGVEKLAEYANMSKELPLIIIASSVTAVFIPQISKLIGKHDFNSAVDLWKKSIEVTYLTNSWIIGILLVLAKECVDILYSSKYLDGVNIFRIFVVVLLFRLTYFGMILNGMGQSKKILISAIYALISNILFFLILNPFLGYVSIPISVLLSVIVMNASQLLFTVRALNIKLSSIIPFGRIMLIFLVNLLIGCFIYFLKDFLLKDIHLNSVVSLMSMSVIWLILYALVFFKPILQLKKELTFSEKRS
ncbi:oligosaccharide flippase family protein [Priestia megaterium]|uniref:oligosaccharide flippase family protein n=1 Tax=Priestia megaterium TaxID=1404 RepID=UPI00244832D1|nr:oligosaccharide flippase family protein [Priestia megaterium]MDH2363754.1 oligosaccharide flippase family protein [Priestia megaterium]